MFDIKPFILIGSLIVFGYAFVGCKKYPFPAGMEVVAYDGSPTLKSLTEIVEEIEVVRLQDADSVLVDDRVGILQCDSSLYLVDRYRSDGQGIYRFALDGRFLGKIGSEGRGKEEFPHLLDVQVAEKEDEVYVVSEPYFTQTCYTKEGIFKSKRQVDILVAGRWRLPDCYWVYSGIGEETKPPCLLRLDTALCVTDTVFLPVNPWLKKALPFSMFTQNAEEANFWPVPFPVVYHLSADTARAVVFFDFGDDYPTWQEIVTGDTRKLQARDYVLLTNYWESQEHVLALFGMFQAKKIGGACCGLKHKASGRWDWMTFDASSEKQWYLDRMCGFAKDGRLMCFFFGNELEELPEDARKLIRNPEKLENFDPEVDMFVLLCRLK